MLSPGKHPGEEVVRAGTMAAAVDLFADVLREVPSGPPCMSSIESILGAYARSDSRLLASQSSGWIRAESEKIHMMWRLIWNCWKRSPTSRKGHVMVRLKSILTEARVKLGRPVHAMAKNIAGLDDDGDGDPASHSAGREGHVVVSTRYARAAASPVHQ